MQLSVIIVNYNVRYFLEHCLVSVFRAAQGLNVEVFVVDNQSNDGSTDMVREKFPQAILIENWQNAGFGRANNQAFDKSTGQYVLFLNPDTIIAEDCFQRCIQFMETHPAAGAMGCRLLDGRGRFLPESKRGFPSVPVAFFKIAGLSGLFPRSRFFNRYHLGYLSEDETNPVDVLAGCFMFCRRGALKKTGAFDTDYFMYGEDIDLSYRIKKAGYENWYFPEVQILHFKGESTNKGSLNYVKMFYQAMIIFARKHFSGAQKGLFVLFIQIAIYLRAILSFVIGLLVKIQIPLLDAFLMLIALFSTKKIWLSQVKPDTHYPTSMLTGFFSLYILLWIVSLYFNGAYDTPFRSVRVLRGMLVGGILTVAIYGLLPEPMRFSRGITVSGALLSVFLILMARYMLRWAGVKQLEPDQTRKPVIIAGTPEEEHEVKQLLHSAHIQKNIVGSVSPFDFKQDTQLGTFPQLNLMVRLYQVREIIFVQNQLSFSDIIQSMRRLSSSAEFKIHVSGTSSIIGSNSKNTAGDLYTTDFVFTIDTPSARRNKRMADVCMALLFILGSPLLFWWAGNRKRYFLYHVLVLEGDLTYVGYHDTQFPPLKPHLLTVFPPCDSEVIPDDNAEHLNWLYARNYSVWQDLKLIVQKWKKIGVEI
ncbi:MAG TPA: glycosyltransferase, partial [Chitinophagaceae bacterium]|nr:glycosyltransferase [Chitinophagaceae bacterium]